MSRKDERAGALCRATLLMRFRPLSTLSGPESSAAEPPRGVRCAGSSVRCTLAAWRARQGSGLGPMADR